VVSTVDIKTSKKTTKNNQKILLFHPLALYQKRYNRDRKYRFRLQKQIEEEYERHSRLEDILRKSGSSESLKSFIGKNQFSYFLSIFVFVIFQYSFFRLYI
jgi:hypothetical protein